MRCITWDQNLINRAIKIHFESTMFLIKKNKMPG